MVKDYKDREHKIITPILNDWYKQNPDGPLVPSQKTLTTILPHLMGTPRIRHTSFSSSSAGKCPRRQVLDYLAEEALFVPDYRMANIFSDGKWRHVRWQVALLESGALDNIEVRLRWKRMRTLGSMDGQGTVPANHPMLGWRNEEFGFELKGVNPFTYSKIMKKKIIMDDHMEQIQRYMLISGLKLFVVIYENKGTNEYFEWVIPADSQMQEDSRAELEVLNDSVDQQLLPEPLPSCLLAMGDSWKGCPYAGTQPKSGPCMEYHTSSAKDPFAAHRAILLTSAP